MTQTINHLTEAERQRYLEWLYTESGRSNGLYTGLYQQRVAELVAADMQFSLTTERP